MKTLINMFSPFLGHALLNTMILIALFGGIMGLLSLCQERPDQVPIAIFSLCHLLLPVISAGACCIRLQESHQGAAWGTGLGIALAAALFNAKLFQTHLFEIDNLLLIFYLLGGFLIIFLLASFFSTPLGYLMDTSPHQKVAYISKKPWLLPFLLPFIPLLGYSISDNGWSNLFSTLSFKIIPFLFLVITPFFLLRHKTRQHSLKAWFNGYLGYMIGLAVSIGIFHNCLDSSNCKTIDFAPLIIYLTFTSPLIGYSLGYLISIAKRDKYDL